MQYILLVNVTSQKILPNQMKIYYKLKHHCILFYQYISRLTSNLFSIVSGAPAPEIVRDYLLSVKDAGKKVKRII